MFNRIYHIMRKEFLQILRDKQMVRIVLIVPVIQLLLFGYVVTTDIKNIETAICDMDRSPESRDLLMRLTSSHYFQIVQYVDRYEDLRPIIDAGKAKVAIGLPPHFGRDLKKGRTAQILIIIDGTNSNTATIASNYATKIIENYNNDLIFEKLEARGIRIQAFPPLEGEERIWFNPDLKSVRYMVPGIICLLLMQLLIPLTSMGIVKEREKGTMEQIMVTPIKPFEFILGKTIPFAVIGYINIFLILLIGTFWFRVPIKGSLLLIFLLSGIFIITALGIGIFISTISKNRQQAVMTGQFIIVPNILLSGFMFPIASMPDFLQYVTYIIPLRYFLIIIRGIFLKGSRSYDVWEQIVALAFFGIVVIGLSILKFRKGLE